MGHEDPPPHPFYNSQGLLEVRPSCRGSRGFER